MTKDSESSAHCLRKTMVPERPQKPSHLVMRVPASSGWAGNEAIRFSSPNGRRATMCSFFVSSSEARGGDCACFLALPSNRSFALLTRAKADEPRTVRHVLERRAWERSAGAGVGSLAPGVPGLGMANVQFEFIQNPEKLSASGSSSVVVTSNS
ncbi:hypothetical protein DL93DRAFT_1565141 [Clavulina sp. PMI_390]|nr:hypothetical protein DL93DRAFT_1565141 [Clavulina sp. PMI_390]